MTFGLLLAVKLAIAAMILAIGMSSTLSDLNYLWFRPKLLLRSLLAMYVVVPLVMLAIVDLFPIAPAVKAALLVLAVSAGAPLLPRKISGIGNGAYIFSLVVTSSLVAIVVVPAWIAFLSPYFQPSASLLPLDVALIVGKSFLLPLTIGLILNRAAPAFSDKVAAHLLPAGGLLLIAAGGTVLALNWDIVLQVQTYGLLALLTLMLAALSAGHLLGGPSPDDRTALAVACATRHVGIATLVATAFPGVRTLVLVAAYTLCSAVVSVPYLFWRHRLTDQRSPRQPAGNPSTHGWQHTRSIAADPPPTAPSSGMPR
jgi:BASS family bile acid:Na+ symporter